MPRNMLSLAAAAMVVAAFVQADATSSPAQAACVVGVASWDVLWMRSGPSKRYRRIGSIEPGACGVRVYWGSCRRGGRWCKVRYAGVRGWVNMRYIDEGGDGGGSPYGAGSGGVLGTACVSGVAYGDVLWVRSGPSVRYRRKGKLPPGLCGITVENNCRGNWCRIITPAGYTGWVNTRYLSIR